MNTSLLSRPYISMGPPPPRTGKLTLLILVALALLATTAVSLHAYFLPKVTSPDTNTRQTVWQGEVPGLGPMTLTLKAGQLIAGGAFGQRNGAYYSLYGTENQGMLKLALVSGAMNATNGWLTLNWPAQPAAAVTGKWVAQSGRAAMPVKFQPVAQIWQLAREHRGGVLAEGERIIEWTAYPVFPPGWQMDGISQSLRQSWWQPLLSWREQHFIRGAIKAVKCAVNPQAFKPLDLNREAELLFVSDKLVSVFTCADTEVQLASSTRRETWNYVKTASGFRRYFLADLFRAGAPWADRLASLCLKQLGPLPEQNTVNHLSASQLSEFVVLPAGLLVQFDPATFGVGEDNDYHVLIPWSQLQDLLNPHSPARFFVPVSG